MSISAFSPARVLVVDDMSPNRELVKQVLSSDQYHVTEAGDGATALELISKHEFDAVLLDVMMPGMDGFEVCEAIRKNPDNALLPILLLSALGGPDDVAQGMKVGANDYISKPFNGVELKARLKASVEHKRLTDRLGDIESVLFPLARMVEARDENTGDHCDRLIHMGLVFGKELGLDYDQLESLRRGSVLHDIGKLGIPDAILLKKGKLDGDEWEVMKQHPAIGAALCSPLKTMRGTVDIIRCHHEKWNGSGYPAGLKGEQIPYLARVFQVIDIYDALSTERPFKLAFPKEKVIQIMQEETEKGFWDPELVDRFLNLLNTRGEDLKRPESSKADRSA